MALPENCLQYGRAKSCIRELAAYGARKKQEIGAENVFDFSLGNPSILPPVDLNETEKKLLEQRPETVHAYTSAVGIVGLRENVSKDLNNRFGTNLSADNIFISTGCAGALIISFKAITQPGDEIIAIVPHFPEYKVYIEGAGAKLVRVNTREDFGLDFEAINNVINEHTVAIIINSPNNPSGVIYPESDLRKLADLLTEASAKFNKTIYCITDEPYRELIYTGEKYHSPIEYYDNTLMCYSWSKSLSLPGERIGYIAVSDRCKDAREVYTAIQGAARLLGYVSPPSLIQFVMEKHYKDVVNLDEYIKNRETLLKGLTEIGYKFAKPDGAFYFLVKALEDDAQKFSDYAKEKYNLLLVPSDGFGVKGYVRLAYCVKNDMIVRALPKLKELFEDYNK